MSTKVKCKVDGCPGMIEISTNGAGRAIESECACCQKRAQWVRQHMPAEAPKPCEICGGVALPRSHTCKACKPIRAKAVAQRAIEPTRGRRAPLRAVAGSKK